MSMHDDYVPASDADSTETQPPILELVNPETGGRVYVLGSAHISTQSAQDVRDLVERVKPDVIVVELDGERYRKIMDRRGQSAHELLRETASKADSFAKVFWMVVEGNFGRHLFSMIFGHLVPGLVVGCIPGAEMIAAVEAAEMTGAKLVFGDRSDKITMSRCMARIYHAPNLKNKDEEYKINKDENLQERRQSVSALSLLDTWGEGCEDPEETHAAGRRLLAGVMMADETKITLKDLLKVRACAKVKVEQQKYAVQDYDSLKNSRVAAFKPIIQNTFVHERDLLLARSLQLEEAQVVVGVVGAGHLPGIKEYWDEARSPANFNAAREYLLAHPADVPQPSTLNKMTNFATLGLMGLGTVALFRHRPRTAAVLTGGVGTLCVAWGSAIIAPYSRVMRGLEALSVVAEQADRCEVQQDKFTSKW